MMGVRRRLACCARDREISIDFDENQLHRVVTYDGLESCILNSQAYRDDSTISREEACLTDPYDEERTSCSSIKDEFGFGSMYYGWTPKRDNAEADDWGDYESPQHSYPTHISDVESMKEKFANLLLGNDVTGGCKGITSALAISNAITNLAATIFGELWKLEPIQEESKAKWRKEMDWLLSPANYMVELVPAKQNGVNGGIFEIMTPKARADINMNLPALQKLDSMLIEALDSMVSTEFWYTEGNSRKEGKGGGESARESKRWWIPSPRVPVGGLSETARKKLLSLGNLVHQVFKAAKSINEDVIHEMPPPKALQDVLPKSGRACLGEGLYKLITSESNSARDIVDALKLRNEHEVLETINKLEAAQLAWKGKIEKYAINSKTPVRPSWPFIKESVSEFDKTESLLLRVDALLCQLKMRYPCLPHTFIDATKLQYCKDIGHSILEAYSRVVSNLAYSILSRIGDVLQEDHSSNPSSPLPSCCFPSGFSLNGITFINSVVHPLKEVDGYLSDSNPSRTSDSEGSLSSDTKLSSSVTATPSSGRIWCIIGKDACSHIGSPHGWP